MSKKTFQNRPVPNQPNPEDVANFIQSGPGLDQKSSKLVSQEGVKPAIRINGNLAGRVTGKPDTQKADKPAFVNFTVKIPADLHRRYKASCSMRGVKMVDEIMEFIAQEIASNID